MRFLKKCASYLRRFFLILFFESCRFLPQTFRYFLAKWLCLNIFKLRKDLDSILSQAAPNAILFIAIKAHLRESRFAKIARLAGWNPLLIYCGKVNYALEEDFQSHTPAKNIFQLVVMSWLFQGPLIHLFAPTGEIAYPFTRIKSRPLILDLYDTCSGLTNTPLWKKALERKAIGLSDGITHRDLRIKLLHRFFGYPLPPHNTLIHDPLIPVSQKSTQNKKEEMHIVSVGFINEKENTIIRTISSLCKVGIHVHVYFNPMAQNGDWVYRELQRNSKYFHIEQPLFGASYWEHLSQYDFGLSLFEPSIFGESATTYTQDYLQGCGSSRLADYISVGLGVIITPILRFQYFLAKRYAPVVVEATQAFLEDPKTVLQRALDKKRAAPSKNVKPISLEEGSRRLDQLYRNVLIQNG